MVEMDPSSASELGITKYVIGVIFVRQTGSTLKASSAFGQEKSIQSIVQKLHELINKIN